jgi:hypothetical protein
MSNDTVGRLAIRTVTLAGHKVGAAYCWINLFGSPPIRAIAAVCDDQKWVSDEDDVRRWLVDKGLSAHEADALLVRAKLQSDDVAGLLAEEVAALVDGVLDNFRGLPVGPSKTKLLSDVADAAAQSSWVKNRDLACAAIPLFTEKPEETALAMLRKACQEVLEGRDEFRAAPDTLGSGRRRK